MANAEKKTCADKLVDEGHHSVITIHVDSFIMRKERIECQDHLKDIETVLNSNSEQVKTLFGISESEYNEAGSVINAVRSKFLAAPIYPKWIVFVAMAGDKLPYDEFIGQGKTCALAYRDVYMKIKKQG